MMKKFSMTLLTVISLLTWASTMHAGEILVEAESFAQKGGWKTDAQFMDLMGSTYLLAHGMGVPVDDASTTIDVTEAGTYKVYVRTYNWTSPWHKGAGPGAFQVALNGRKLRTKVGIVGDKWMWQALGEKKLKSGTHKLSLHDLTGFDGRVDAIYLTTGDALPPSDMKELAVWRRKQLNYPAQPEVRGQFDFVVTGGGLAGICAAVSAARQGMKVALIQDRPVLGGNNSSEIRVHAGGRINIGPYKNLGNLIKEFGHTTKGNAQPAANYEDEKKMNFVRSFKNIHLFCNNRVHKVTMNGDKIRSVISRDIVTGKDYEYIAPLFADCTGDGTVGALAGADFRMGRESKYEFGEERAPEKADKMTMGTSIQWYSEEGKRRARFPKFEYGLGINAENVEKVTMGEWTWETGMNFHQIDDFEYVRDYGMMVVYSNWSYLKNAPEYRKEFAKRYLSWVAFVGGKRESRRLLGDYILTMNDVVDYREYVDGTAATTWSIDLHYPDPENTKHFPGREFKSIAKHTQVHPYPVPYRCLYSRNVNNLYMAGRNISVTHCALGTVRVMRTGGMLGEVIGLAASVCKKHDVLPRRVYQKHFDDLKTLMVEGAGDKNAPDNQNFTLGGTRRKKPKTAVMAH